MNGFRFLFTAILFVLVAGCVQPLIPRPERMPSPEEALQRLRERRYPTQFRSIVQVQVQLSDGQTTPFYLQDFFTEGSESFAGKAVLIWKTPNFLRMEILSPFGSPVFVVTADGKVIRALSISQKRFYVGRADPKTMARWLGLPVSLEQMVRVLQGNLIPERHLSVEDMRIGWDSERGEIRVEFSAEDGARNGEQVFLEPNALEVRGGQMGGGKDALEVRYGLFRRYGESEIPDRVEIQDLSGRRRLRILLAGKETPPTGELPEDLFTLHIPPGATVFPLFRSGS